MSLYILHKNKDNTQVMNNIHLHLARLNPAKDYTVTIEPKKAKRTLQQNNYIHDLCRILMDTGYTLTQLKRMLAAKAELFEEYPINGKMEKSPKHTSDMTIDELGQCIEIAQELCLTLGYQYPLPNAHFGHD